MTPTTYVYGIGLCITGVVGIGLLLENHGYPTRVKRYRMGARMLVTCWVWPLWLVYGIYLLLGAAEWLPDKPHKPSWLHWPHRTKTPKDTP